MDPSTLSLIKPQSFRKPAKAFPVLETEALYGPGALSYAHGHLELL